MFWGDGQTKNDVPTDILTDWFPRRAGSGRDGDFSKLQQLRRHCGQYRCINNEGECGDGTLAAGKDTDQSCDRDYVQAWCGNNGVECGNGTLAVGDGTLAAVYGSDRSCNGIC